MICRLVVEIEKYYQNPMDVEFAFYGKELFVLQARPITHLLEVPNRVRCSTLLRIVINPLIHPYAMEWGVYVNLGHIQMLTDPFTPMGYSLFRAVTHLSEKYLLYVNGFIFINIAGFTNNCLLRKVTIRIPCRGCSQLERFETEVDAELAQIVREVYKSDYPYFDHKQAAQAYNGIKRDFVKPLIKGVIRNAWKRASVDDMEKELLSVIEDMMSIADELAKLLEEKEMNVQFHDALKVKFDFFELNVRIKTIVKYLSSSMTKITTILEKNGMKGEEDQLWPLSEGNLAKQMSDNVIRLGRCARTLKKEEELKVIMPMLYEK